MGDGYENKRTQGQRDLQRGLRCSDSLLSPLLEFSLFSAACNPIVPHGLPLLARENKCTFRIKNMLGSVILLHSFHGEQNCD
jgi:hypothetical protein